MDPVPMGRPADATTVIVRLSARPLSYSAGYSTAKDHGPAGGVMACELAGVRGLEPRTSSLSGCRSARFGSAIGRLTCGSMLTDPIDSPRFTPIAPAALGPL